MTIDQTPATACRWVCRGGCQWLGNPMEQVVKVTYPDCLCVPRESERTAMLQWGQRSTGKSWEKKNCHITWYVSGPYILQTHWACEYFVKRSDRLWKGVINFSPSWTNQSSQITQWGFTGLSNSRGNGKRFTGGPHFHAVTWRETTNLSSKDRWCPAQEFKWRKTWWDENHRMRKYSHDAYS